MELKVSYRTIKNTLELCWLIKCAITFYQTLYDTSGHLILYFGDISMHCYYIYVYFYFGPIYDLR